MSQEIFKAKAYLRKECPFSFKFLLFMSEAGLMDRIEVICCDPATPQFERVKSMLAEATGKKARFPTVEIEPGRYKSDSDALIEYYAARHNIAVDTLPALSFYKESIFPQLLKLHSSHYS